jgi:hypothetical protein
MRLLVLGGLLLAGVVVTNVVLVKAKVAGLLFEYRPPETSCREPLGIEVRWCTANAEADELAACHVEGSDVVCGKPKKGLWCTCALGEESL